MRRSSLKGNAGGAGGLGIRASTMVGSSSSYMLVSNSMDSLDTAVRGMWIDRFIERATARGGNCAEDPCDAGGKFVCRRLLCPPMRTAIVGFWLALTLAACGGETKVYECPMHCVPQGSTTEVTSNEPGKCPVCGMDLVERRRN